MRTIENSSGMVSRPQSGHLGEQYYFGAYNEYTGEQLNIKSTLKPKSSL